jgi:hypothetical protein
MPEISAAQADEMVGGAWFAGYTDGVDLHDGPVTVDGFDAGARADALGRSEYAVFGAGLVVDGTMSLDADPCRSIYVVRGPLHARRIILGDAVLVVQGDVDVDEWLFGAGNEGVFEVLGHIRAPLTVLYDRGRGRFVLRERGEARAVGDLLPALLDDDTWHGVNEKLLRERVCAGAPIFR